MVASLQTILAKDLSPPPIIYLWIYFKKEVRKKDLSNLVPKIGL